MQRELERIARRDVDLIVLKRGSTILAFQAIKHGYVIACCDLLAYQCCVVRLITEYADFKIICRPIEEAVIKRSIYAES